jgi:hypothetical protein
MTSLGADGVSSGDLTTQWSGVSGAWSMVTAMTESSPQPESVQVDKEGAGMQARGHGR